MVEFLSYPLIIPILMAKRNKRNKVSKAKKRQQQDREHPHRCARYTSLRTFERCTISQQPVVRHQLASPEDTSFSAGIIEHIYNICCMAIRNDHHFPTEPTLLLSHLQQVFQAAASYNGITPLFSTCDFPRDAT